MWTLKASGTPGGVSASLSADSTPGDPNEGPQHDQIQAALVSFISSMSIPATHNGITVNACGVITDSCCRISININSELLALSDVTTALPVQTTTFKPIGIATATPVVAKAAAAVVTPAK